MIAVAKTSQKFQQFGFEKPLQDNQGHGMSLAGRVLLYLQMELIMLSISSMFLQIETHFD